MYYLLGIYVFVQSIMIDYFISLMLNDDHVSVHVSFAHNGHHSLCYWVC